MTDAEDRESRLIVVGIVSGALGLLAIIGAGLQAIELYKSPARRDCHIIGYTASTLYTGTTASGERVIVHAPPTAICKKTPQ